MKTITAILLCSLTALLTGCVSQAHKPVLVRGWIGGQYLLSKPPGLALVLKADTGVDGSLSKTLQRDHRAAIRIVYLATNTPASLAGLRPGDFIVDFNDRPVTSLQSFYRTIDHTRPGDSVALKIYRAGQFTNCTVAVGREKFKTGGYLTIFFPTVVHNWDLWPNPGFSLVVLGYEPNPGLRRELGASAHKGDVYDQEWCAFLGFLEISMGKRVVSQEPITPTKG